MTVEELLSSGREVRLARRDAQEVLQKLRARGAESEAAATLESRMAESDEVLLTRDEAERLLSALKASGRRWISGTDAPRPEPPRKHEPEPEPVPEPRSWRFWRKRPQS